MSGCDVCIGHDNDDPAEFCEVEIRKARKSHKCCECGREIEPGESYEHVRGKWYGEIDSFDTCLLCVEIRTVFSCGESWQYQSLWEDMEEYAFERLTTASECFTELSAEAKAFVLERWRKWKGLAA